MSSDENIPFAMTLEHEAPIGYDFDGESTYDPESQMGDLPSMGETSPTTHSSISSTGLFNQDTDRGADDEGTD
jgi:hypothetical protein